MPACLCLLAASVATAALAVAPESVFKFQVPTGWLDLSPGAPRDNFEQVAPEAAAIAQSGKFAAYAFDVAGATERFTANENVQVQQARIQIDQTTLPQIRAGMERAQSPTGPAVKVTDASLRKIGGFDVARLVLEMSVRGVEVRQIAYLIPAADQTATLTFTVERSRFDEYVDAIDIAAGKTEGVGAAAGAGSGFNGVQWIAVVALAAAAFALFAGLRSRKSRPQA